MAPRQLPSFKKLSTAAKSSPSLPEPSSSTTRRSPSPAEPSRATGSLWYTSLNVEPPRARPRSITSKKYGQVDFDRATPWLDGYVLLGANTNYMPTPPSLDDANVCVHVDGSWGQHEYTLEPQPFDYLAPYLAFLPVPANGLQFDKHILFRRPHDSDCTSVDPLDNVDTKGAKFFLSPGVRNDMMYWVWELREDRRQASDMLARVFAKGWDRESTRAQLFRSLKAPLRAQEHMFHAHKALSLDGVKSREQFDLCWYAMQREAREVIAYVNFCAALLPNTRARERLQPRRRLTDFSQRGSILNGDDISAFYQLFVKYRIPVYGVFEQRNVPLNRSELEPASPRRVILVDEKLTRAARVKSIEMPPFCAPPQNVDRQSFEAVARGFLPRQGNTSDAPKPPPSKKQKLDRAGKAKAKGENEKKGISSKERYNGFTSTNPAFIRQFHIMIVTRPHYMPQAVPEFERAHELGFNYLFLLPEDQKGHLASFFPPVHLLHGCQSAKRVSLYTSTVVKLLPLLLKRISLAPTDPSIIPFSGKQWKAILGGEYWRKQWPEGDLQGEFSMEADFWKYGGESFFGTAESERIRRGGKATMGKLLCGCTPTLEKIGDDSDLIASVVYCLNQCALLHTLSTVAQNTLATAKFPAIRDGPRVRRFPDFTAAESQRMGAAQVFQDIKDIVMKGKDFPSTGWPEAWSGVEEVDEEAQRKWVMAMAKFLLVSADRTKDFDGKPGWMSRLELAAIQSGSFEGKKLGQMQQEVINRYFVSCLMAGEWPAEFLRMPARPQDAGMCRQCLLATQVPPGMSLVNWDDFADDDE